MKLSQLLEYIDTYNRIRLCHGGEEFYPPYGELFRYKDYYVTDIRAEGANALAITVTSEQ